MISTIKFHLPNGQRDEPPSVGGGNCILMQFTVPNDRAERDPKGVGSIEFDRRSAFGAEPIKFNRDISLPDKRSAEGGPLIEALTWRAVFALKFSAWVISLIAIL